jgi:hypothetical protein
MKAYWGSESIAPHILNLATRWRWVVSFTPRPLYSQVKDTWYPLDRRLGGPQSRSERGISKYKAGIKPLHCNARYTECHVTEIRHWRDPKLKPLKLKARISSGREHKTYWAHTNTLENILTCWLTLLFPLNEVVPTVSMFAALSFLVNRLWRFWMKTEIFVY